MRRAANTRKGCDRCREENAPTMRYEPMTGYEVLWLCLPCIAVT